MGQQLNKWKRNEVFQAIQIVGMDPLQFSLEEDDHQARIRHKPSDSYFIIRATGGYYSTLSKVGDNIEWPGSASSWQPVETRIRNWLEEVKSDFATPDLWAELQHKKQLFNIISDNIIENTPFAPDEQNEIARRLEALAEGLQRSYSLSEEQTCSLNEKLDYLVDAARRLGRKDWLSVCAATILGYILSAALPPEAFHQMCMGILHGIGHLWGLPDLPMLPD